MMEREKKKYILMLCLCMLVLLICGCGKKEESYRMIKIMSLNGTAKITRENIGELDAYVDMRLESGDAVAVGKDSNLVLSLDDDKYVMLEPETKMTLLAEGNSADSRTVIHMTEGAVVNQIVKPLSEDSSYEVTVPNSTMAVRGTVFRVAVEYDENGDSYAVVSVLDGVVASRLIYPDGTVQSEEEEREVPTGKMVRVHGDENTSEYYPDELRNVDLEEFPVETLEFLLFCMEHEEALCVTEVKVEEMIAERLVRRGMDPEEIEGLKDLEEDAPEPETEETQTPEEIPEDIPEDISVTGQIVNPEEVLQETALPGASSDTSSGGTKDSSSKTESGGNDASDGEDSDTDDPVSVYTVTFRYNGTVFCTQSVESGKKASVPALLPAPEGSWDYDFNTEVHSDTTIEWK